MSSQSEEYLIASVAKELLLTNAFVTPAFQVAIAADAEELKLPAIVLTAKFDSADGLSSRLPAKYSLTAELRGIASVHPSITLDEIMRQIGICLCPPSGTAVIPTPSMAAFTWLRIEVQTGSEMTRGDDNANSKTFMVLASFP